MSCTLEYINKTTATKNGEEKKLSELRDEKTTLTLDELLTNIHQKVASDILVFDKFKINTYSFTKVGETQMTKFLHLPKGDSKAVKDKTTQLIVYLNELNTKYKALYKIHEDLIGYKRVVVDGKDFIALRINTLPILNTLKIDDYNDNFTGFTIEDGELETYFTNIQEDKLNASNYLFESKSDFFFDILEKGLKPRIATYLVNANPQTFAEKKFKKDLIALQSKLVNPEDSSKIFALKDFIYNSINFYNVSSAQLKQHTKDITDIINLYGEESNSKEKISKLSAIAKEVNSIKDNLYLFEYLKEFLDELNRQQVNDDVFEKYNKFKLQKVIKTLITDEAIADKVIENIINKSYSSVSNFRREVMIELLKNKVDIQDDSFLDDIRYSTAVKDGVEVKGFVESIEEAVIGMQDMIPTVRNTILDLTAYTLYPSITSSWSEKNDKFENTYKPTYEQFKASLTLAEETPNMAMLWLAAGEQQQDYILKSTAKFLHDILKVEDIKSKKRATDSLDILKTIFGVSTVKEVVGNKNRLQYEKDMTSYIYEILEEQTIQFVTKNGDNFEETINDSLVTYTVQKTNTDYLGNVLEVQLNNGQWLLKVTDFSGEKWVKVKQTKALVHNYSYKYDIENKVFVNSLDYITRDISKIVKSTLENKISQKNTLTEIRTQVESLQYSEKLVQFIDKLIKDSAYGTINITEELSFEKIKSTFYVSFNAFHTKNESGPKTTNELYYLTNTLDFENYNNKHVQKWLRKNSREINLKSNNGYTNLSAIFKNNSISLLMSENVGIFKTKEEKLIQAELREIEGSVKLYSLQGDAIDITTIESFFVKDKNLTELSDYYKKKQEVIDLEQKIASDNTFKLYYGYIKDTHDKATEEVIIGSLKNYVLPQIHKRDTKGIFEQISGIKDIIKEKKVTENLVKETLKLKNNKKVIVYKNNLGQYLDEHGDPLPEGTEPLTYFQNRQTLDGIDTFKLTPKFITRLENQDNVENDLFISLSSFTDSVGKYVALFDVEPQIKFLKLINNGTIDTINNNTLFSGRKVKTNNKTSIHALFQKSNSEHLVKNLDQFINHYMYGIGKVESNILGINGQKLSSLLKGLNAYQSLAFNFVAAFTNVEVGVFSNYSAGVGKKYGISKANIDFGYKEYFKNLGDIVTSRFKTNNIYERDHLTQLAILFDAIKGDAVTVGDSFDKQTSLLDKFKKGIFVTSSAPEHMNQIPLMIGFMKSYVIEDSHTMWDAYVNGSKDKTTINLVGKDGYDLDTSVILDFYNKLDVINSEAHGNYGQYQTAMAERYAMASLGLQFGRWIYKSVESRFHKGKYNLQTENYVYRGHQRWYLKSLLQEAIAIKDEFIGENIQNIDSRRLVFSTIGKAIGQTAINFTAKQALYFVNTVTKQSLTKNSQWVDNFLYGNRDRIIVEENLEKVEGESEDEFQKRVDKTYTQKKEALIRASFEISVFIMSALVAALLSSLQSDDDDDDLRNKSLKFLEIQVRRFNSDIGLFTPSVNPFKVYDFLSNKAKDPLVINALINNNVNFLLQLGGFKITNEGIDLNYNDIYEKAGPGYDAGDYKLFRKTNKTALAPIGQIMKLMNNSELENTLKLYNRNAIVQTE